MNDKVQGGVEPQTAGATIMASVSCVTFNHVSYIRTTLNNFLMQETDLAFEVLIHDNASTSGASDVIWEYAARYPEKVKPLIQTENQYSQGIDNINGVFNFPRAGGKYIFMYDGDGYFLSPDKLQKQVDYMETHLDYTPCVHSANIDLVGEALTEGQMKPYRRSHVLSPEEIIDKPSGYAMSSMAFSAHLVGDLPNYYMNCSVGDTSIQLITATNGYGYHFDEAMSAYRTDMAGSQIAERKNGNYHGKRRAYCDRMGRIYEQFDRATGGRSREATESAARRTYYQAMANTKQFEGVSSPQYRGYYRELMPRMRFFSGLEHTMPAVYEMARRAFIRK